MQIPLEGYSHTMGVVSNGDNPIGPEIRVHYGTSSSSTGTKAHAKPMIPNNRHLAITPHLNAKVEHPMKRTLL